jgi:beta-glucuronidase
MLRPQDNDFREFIALDGLWAHRADPLDVGEAQGWTHGFEPEAWVAMPGSVNEQLAERGLRDYIGATWLMWRGTVPRRWAGQALRLHVGSADLMADLWLDGVHLGHEAAPFLPFERRVVLEPGAEFTLVVRLDGRLPPDHPLPGITAADYGLENRPRDEIYPAVRYDFFPYLGLHRSLYLCAEPLNGLRALCVRGDFDPTTRTGHVALAVHGGSAWSLRARLRAAGGELLAEAHAAAGGAGDDERELTLSVPDAAAWSPVSPVLHRLEVELLDGGRLVDRYAMPLGLRRVQVQGTRLLLNGEPLVLRGFGMHEDFPVLGKGSCAALRVKDFELLRWVGANSLRTSHYAYAEETLDEADRRGVLVIGELASVNLDFRRTTATTLADHCAQAGRLIARDGHHACVIAWSLSNEPGYLAEPEYRERAGPYFETLFAHARRCDPSRPLTAANVGRNGIDDPMYGCCDFLSLNRYHGWYDMPGQLERAVQHLAAELHTLAERYGKPLLLTEFGADAIPGMHASSDQLFTEEYQAEFLAAYWSAIEAEPACIGGQVWNFADFRTAQHHRRVQFNHKGVFTRTRDPKMAAWRLRTLWQPTIGAPSQPSRILSSCPASGPEPAPP